MNHFRLAILDYPKQLLEISDANRMLSDVIISKQKGFERSSPDYVSLDSLDMISTHILIYDTKDLFQPKPVLAIRICYSDRAERHHLSLPIDNYISSVPLPGQKAFNDIRRNKNVLVDCNAWFVDPDYTFSKTGVPLSDIGFFAVATMILRRGNDHLVGCSNEKFKASRWVNHIGNLVAPVLFTHPKVPVPHQLVMIDGFSNDWLSKSFSEYKHIIHSRVEFIPESESKKMLSLEQIQEELFLKPRVAKAA